MKYQSILFRLLLIYLLPIFSSCNKNITLENTEKVSTPQAPVVLREKTKITLFGNGETGVQSGVTYPSANDVAKYGRKGYHCDVSYNSTTKQLYTSVTEEGVWAYDTASGHGYMINNTTTSPAGSYQVTGDVLPDPTAGTPFIRCVSSVGSYLAVGVTYTGIWLLNTDTMVAKMYSSGIAGSGGGDAFPAATNYISVKIVGGKVIANLRSKGMWVLDLSSNVSTLYSNTTTAGAGSHQVTGDAYYGSNIGQVGMNYDSTRDIFMAGGEGGGTWIFDHGANTAKLLTVANTQASQPYEIQGDSLPEDEMYYVGRGINGGKVVGVGWSTGAYIYDFDTNTGINLTATSTAAAGSHEVNGDPIPDDGTLGIDWNPDKEILFYAMRATAGFWIYNMKTNTGTHLQQDDYGTVVPGPSWAIYYDASSRTLFAKLETSQVIMIELSDTLSL